MDYGTGDDDAAWDTLADGERAYVARYALGRDYHKLMRDAPADSWPTASPPRSGRSATACSSIRRRCWSARWRATPGLGWIGKNTCLIDKDAGSWFFLGEIYIDLPLPVDPPASAHCGTCTRCIEVCPTQAIVAPEPRGCAALHQLPDHRTRRRDPRGAARR